MRSRRKTESKHRRALRAVVLTLSLGLISIASATAEAALTKLLPADVQATGALTVIASHGSPPMAFIGDDGRTLRGLEIDLVNAIGEVLGVKVEFVNGTFDSLIGGIRSGRADFATGSIGDLKKREEQVDFVDFAKAGMALMVPRGNPKKLDGLASLCGASIAVVRGTYQEAQLNKQSEKCNSSGQAPIDIQNFTDGNGAFLALRSNRADAWMGDSAPVGYVIKQSNGEFQLAGSNAPIALLGFAVSKDKPQIRDALKAALEALQKSGKYQAVFEKWGQAPNMLEKISINDAYL